MVLIALRAESPPCVLVCRLMPYFYIIVYIKLYVVNINIYRVGDQTEKKHHHNTAHTQTNSTHTVPITEYYADESYIQIAQTRRQLLKRKVMY